MAKLYWKTGGEDIMAGRKPRPTAIKILEGEPNKDRINLNEPKPKLSRPTCPKHLSGVARYEWRRIVPELEALGLLTQIDKAALAAYCQAYGRWVIAERKLSELASMSPDKMAYLYKTVSGNLIINPLLSVANKALEQMHKFLIEFGMTPASRSKINVSKQESDDPLDKLLSTRRKN